MELVLPIIVGIGIVVVLTLLLLFILNKRKKSNPLAGAVTSLNQEQENQNQNISPEPIPQEQIITDTPVKQHEGKYILLLFIGGILALLIPTVTIIVVKNTAQTSTTITQEENSQSFCSAITIADTFNTPLSESDLASLRTGDEIKILIGYQGEKFEKARFRINGSSWQETTQKEEGSFVGNYILEDLGGKYTIEAELFDKENGWL